MGYFYEIAEQCYNDRIKEEYRQRHDINNIASLEYNLFCAWCCAYKDAQFTEQNFKEYAKKEKDLNFWIKKKIFELFFGYEFEFDYNNNKWSCKKTAA